MKESRRDFLRRSPSRVMTAYSALTALASGCERVETSVKLIPEVRIEPSLLSSATSGFAVTGVNMAMIRLGEALGVPLGNSYTVNNKQSVNLVDAVLINPPVEEYLLRSLVSEVFTTQDQGMRWDVGLVSSTVFALTHNFDRKEKPPILTTHIPLPQFTLSLALWRNFKTHQANNNGFLHSTVMHAAQNLGHFIYKAVFAE